MVHRGMFDEPIAAGEVLSAKLAEMMRLLRVLHVSMESVEGCKCAPVASLANDSHLETTRVEALSRLARTLAISMDG